ncbi:hypothetical protein BX616_004780 [Lobosporangium transversale]|nr:hypothetical protein BX616_004780 [Lobosporangium transversale]
MKNDQQQHHNSTKQPPKVLIAGAGLGGLTLAILLEKAQVPYEVYERVVEVKNMGTSNSLGWNIAALFKQIGIYDEFVSISKPALSVDTYNEDRKLEFSMTFKPAVEMSGSEGYFVTRSALYDLLLRQIPCEKIHFGKRIVSTKQDHIGVRVHFADNTIAEGDILVGADGAYSAVRQNFYQQLKRENKLPLSDNSASPFNCVCLVGQTAPLDPAKFPEVLKPHCLINDVVSADKPYSWVAMTMKDNIYCWTVIKYLNKTSSRDDDAFREAEWGAIAAEAMCQEVRHFPIPGGVNNDLTLGDLIDMTPNASKVIPEEKVFETWYSGRVVLLGDASGAGAVNAMHDAVALANWISVLDSPSTKDTERIFKEYRDERYPAVIAAYNAGQTLTKVSGKGWVAWVVRKIAKNMPVWLHNMAAKTVTQHRPQVSFLPLVKDEGASPPKYQPSLVKTLAIHQARAGSASVFASATTSATTSATSSTYTLNNQTPSISMKT